MLGHVASNPDITRYINFYQTYAIAQQQHSAGVNATIQRHTNFATVRGTNIPKDFKMCHFVLVRSVNFLDQCFLVSGLDTVHTPTTTGVNSHANSVQQQQKPFSRTPVCFPGRAGLLGCWQDCLGLAHPVKTVLKLRLKTHHRLDSNDSEEYLSICCHLHTHLDETFWRQIALLEVYLDIPL